jgi:hypothetical protein
MSHVRRLGIGAMFLTAAMILGLVIDTAFYEVLQIVEPKVSGGPFGALIPHVTGVAQIVVPIFMVGTVLWIIWGSIKEERREEQRRRVRRGP